MTGPALRAVALLCFAPLSCGDPAPVSVGVVFSGEGIEGARFAVAHINESGGIRGRALGLRLIVETGTQARAAITAAESLSKDPSVLAIVGHSNSSGSLAGSQIYNERQIVQIAPTSSTAALTDAGPYTFRLVASDVHQSRFIADVLARDSAATPVAVFHVSDDYGRSLYEGLRSNLAAAGVPLVFDYPYSQRDSLTDVAGTVEAVVRSGAARLVWLGRPQQLRQLLRLLRPARPGISVIASDAVDTRETARNADGLMTGVRFVCFVDIQSPRPQLVALRERFRARTGSELSAEVALTYDAVMLVAAAARESGLSRDGILEYLNSLGGTRPAYPGATDDIAFDSNGDPDPSYCLAEVTKDGVKIVGSSSRR
jgi:branched-chain amino acid transport system substrate-binding protein